MIHYNVGTGQCQFSMKSKNYISIIKKALKEDIQTGDLTSLSIFNLTETCKAQLIAKQDGIIAGIKVFKKTFKILDKKVKIKMHFKDGQNCKNKDVIADISGSVISVLGAERVALNLLLTLLDNTTHERHCHSHQSICKIVRRTLPSVGYT